MKDDNIAQINEIEHLKNLIIQKREEKKKKEEEERLRLEEEHGQKRHKETRRGWEKIIFKNVKIFKKMAVLHILEHEKLKKKK